jgi:hypothetical protein
MLKGVLEVGHFYLWEVCEGNLEGGLLWWKRLWRWASLFIGTLVGNLETGSSTRDFER